MDVLICLFLPIPAPQMMVSRHFDELMPIYTCYWAEHPAETVIRLNSLAHSFRPGIRDRFISTG